MNKLQQAEQFRKAMQFYAQTLPEDKAMEIATVYPSYEVGKHFEAGEKFTHGVNSVGDPQLYKVNQSHTSQEDWPPEATPSLYTPIGLNEEGYPVWSKPTGAHDAYNTSDVVDYNGALKESTIDGNIWSPDEYPAGWKDYIN